MALILTGPAGDQKQDACRPLRRADAARARRLRRLLLGWYARNRRRLPWRGTRDPYAVLVSEVMLQQTQVTRVKALYPRFLARYPTLEDLAAAPLDAVRESWGGLGYYARVRNLHAAARAIVAEHGGRVPRVPEALRRLPGIGRYTAGAVASLAFGMAVPAVDTNAARVLARVFGLHRRKGAAAARERRLWALAAALVAPGRAADWNQALMDLGAMVCTARVPRCAACPAARVCVARPRFTRAAPRRPRPRRP
jgi:A/G-specific adenine glycosylase